MKYLFTVLIAVTASVCFAQNPSHKIWTFGDFAGLDFHTQPPTPILTSMYGIESFASECDGQGNLLFYSNGQKLYNRLHVLMPHGDSLLGNQQSTMQGVQVIPMPGNKNQYILLSLASAESYFWTPALSGGLYYSVVDMTLDNGLGDIVPGKKNILVDSMFSEQMIVIKQDCKMWLIVHMKFEPVFKCYEVTNSGLSTTPVISYSQTVGNNFDYVRGEMAYDKVRRHLFLSSMDATFLHGILEMHDFDPGTGVVSNPRLLNNDHIYFRLCISPDASKLYATGNIAPGSSVLKQFDVTLPSAQDIFNSGVTIYSAQLDILADIEIGPDSMIYGVPHITSDSLFRIASPNMPGMACNFTLNAIALLPGSNNMTGLPSPSITRFTPPQIPDETYIHDSTICAGSLSLTAPDTTYYIHVWSTGDTGSAVSVSQSGIYWVTSFTDCRKRVDTFNVADFELIPRVHDTTICFASTATLTAPVTLSSYLWSDGSTGSEITITQPGTYWVFATDFCIETADTFHVSFVDFKMNLPGDTVVCDAITITPSVDVEGATYTWQDGSSNASYTGSTSGIYWVELEKDGCALADTMVVENRAINVSLGNDTMLCENASMTLSVGDGANYLWQDGSTDNSYLVNTAGIYSVMADNGTCTATDSISIGYEKCDCYFGVPTVFTPNGDGKNDRFNPVIESSCPVSEYNFAIYNRFGECVFSSTSQMEKWDGRYKGQLADVGVYMYMLQFTGAKGKKFTRKGDVTLFR